MCIMSSSQQVQQQQLKEIRERPGNHVCAECPELHPSHVSLIKDFQRGGTLVAVLICDQCSQHHVRLGKHFCQVKKLDTHSGLTSNDIATLLDSGNAKVNLIYQANRNLIHTEKPSMDQLSFIKNKYARRKYFSQDHLDRHLAQKLEKDPLGSTSSAHGPARRRNHLGRRATLATSFQHQQTRLHQILNDPKHSDLDDLDDSEDDPPQPHKDTMPMLQVRTPAVPDPSPRRSYSASQRQPPDYTATIHPNLIPMVHLPNTNNSLRSRQRSFSVMGTRDTTGKPEVSEELKPKVFYGDRVAVGTVDADSQVQALKAAKLAKRAGRERKKSPTRSSTNGGPATGDSRLRELEERSRTLANGDSRMRRDAHHDDRSYRGACRTMLEERRLARQSSSASLQPDQDSSDTPHPDELSYETPSMVPVPRSLQTRGEPTARRSSVGAGRRRRSLSHQSRPERSKLPPESMLSQPSPRNVAHREPIGGGRRRNHSHSETSQSLRTERSLSLTDPVPSEPSSERADPRGSMGSLLRRHLPRARSSQSLRDHRSYAAPESMLSERSERSSHRESMAGSRRANLSRQGSAQSLRSSRYPPNSLLATTSANRERNHRRSSLGSGQAQLSRGIHRQSAAQEEHTNAGHQHKSSSGEDRNPSDRPMKNGRQDEENGAKCPRERRGKEKSGKAKKGMVDASEPGRGGPRSSKRTMRNDSEPGIASYRRSPKAENDSDLRRKPPRCPTITDEGPDYSWQAGTIPMDEPTDPSPKSSRKLKKQSSAPMKLSVEEVCESGHDHDHELEPKHRKSSAKKKTRHQSDSISPTKNGTGEEAHQPSFNWQKSPRRDAKEGNADPLRNSGHSKKGGKPDPLPNSGHKKKEKSKPALLELINGKMDNGKNYKTLSDHGEPSANREDSDTNGHLKDKFNGLDSLLRNSRTVGAICAMDVTDTRTKKASQAFALTKSPSSKQVRSRASTGCLDMLAKSSTKKNGVVDDDDENFKPYNWEKPEWTKKAPLKKTILGDKIKQGSSLARPITHVNADKEESRDTNPIANKSALNGRSRKVMNRRNTVTGTEWEKPAWAKSNGLRTTEGGAAARQGENLALPVTMINEVVREKEALAWSKPDWVNEGTLRTSEVGAAARQGENLALPVTMISEVVDKKEKLAWAKPDWAKEGSALKSSRKREKKSRDKKS